MALRHLRGFVRLALHSMGEGDTYTPELGEACNRLEAVYRAELDPADVGRLPLPVKNIFGPVWWHLRGPWPLRIKPSRRTGKQRRALADSKLVKQLVRQMERRPDLRFPPSPGQLDFHQDTGRLRYVMAGNQVGKSMAGAREVHWFATKTHPWRECKHITKEGWVCVASFEGKPWTTISARLYQTADHAAIDWRRSHYTKEKGWRGRIIVYKNGFVVRFVSSKAGSTSAASGSIDFLWVDEPPKRQVWGELLSRVRSTRGPIWMTLTPKDSEQNLHWLRVYLEGDEEQDIKPQGAWSKTVIEFCTRNAPWMTEDQVQEEIDLTPHDERAQRIYGEWEGVVTNRSFSGFTESAITDLDVREGWDEDGADPRLVLWTDHGILPGRQVFLLAAYQPTNERYRLDRDRADDDGPVPRRFGRRIKIRILAEWLNQKPESEEADADHVRSMIEELGLTMDALDYGVGDTNNAGKSKGGRKLNAVYQDLFRSMMRPEAAVRFVMHAAIKGPGMERFQVNLINGYLGRGDLTVHRRCAATIRVMRRWQGKNDEFKHIVDTLRYGIHEADQREGFVAQTLKARF